MTATNLIAPFFGDGLKSIKFFNGRLLSGEDLTTEQLANLRRQERLGLAIGDGVVFGLEVSAGPSALSPTVTVQAGLAFNRSGEAVELTKTIDVGLYAPASTAANGSNVTPFTQCGPTAPGAYLQASGVYLLTIAPACGTQGRAPVAGLLDGTDKCNAKYIVEGVQFRLILLPIAATDLQNSPQLRNIIAAKCFGFDVDPLADPFGAEAPRDLLESLRPSTLTDDEVPIAVLGWVSGTGITFVDMWSARRRIARADAADDSALPLRPRDLARGEATLLQFQDHVQSLMATGPTGVVAKNVFKYLPPLGLLPIYSAAFLGFVQAAFFSGLTVRGPIAIEGGRAEAMIRSSLQYPRIDLSSGEMIWIFRTRQNQQASGARPFVFFVSGQMPYFGESRFDVAHFDFSAWT